MKGWWLSLSKGSPDYVMLQRLGVPGRGISQGKDLEVGWASWGVQETESSQCGCSNIVTEDKGVQDDTGGLPRWLSGKESACQYKRHIVRLGSLENGSLRPTTAFTLKWYFKLFSENHEPSLPLFLIIKVCSWIFLSSGTATFVFWVRRCHCSVNIPPLHKPWEILSATSQSSNWASERRKSGCWINSLPFILWPA